MEWIPDWASSAQYVNLVTFKRDGRSVSTAVWFALDNGKLYIYSNLDAGKMKRVRNNSSVEIGPCDVKGKATGPTIARKCGDRLRESRIFLENPVGLFVQTAIATRIAVSSASVVSTSSRIFDSPQQISS